MCSAKINLVISKLMNYYTICTLINSHDCDEIDFFAKENFASTGVVEFSLTEPQVDKILGERSYSGGDVPTEVIQEVEDVVTQDGVQKQYFFSDTKSAYNFRSWLENTYHYKGIFDSHEYEDWNEQWKKNYKPISVDEWLDVIPEWEKETYHSSAKKQIYIYPGMGFGTGSHETTYLCLKHLIDLVSRGVNISSCLDFGCGSGILGIAARLFHLYDTIDLYDIDKDALKNTEQNIHLNEMPLESFNLLLPSMRKRIDRKYNLVFANILQNVLLAEAEYLANCLDQHSFLILSGLLEGQEQEVIQKYQALNPKLIHVKTLIKGDWVAVLMEQL